MAMALKSNLVYSGIGSGIQAPECWSTTNWELENGTDSWEWEEPAVNYSSRQGEGQLRMQSNEWSSAACSAVTFASSAGASKSGGFSHHHPSGSSTPSGTSISSGIPGVAAGGGDRISVASTLVKDEPDENGAEQVVLGTPATRSGQGDSFFFSLGRSLSQENEENPRGEVDRAPPAGGLSDGSSVMSGGGDCQNVSLKLGRRTYFEDPAGAARAKACSPARSPPGKKQRPLSPSTQIPRCQVEGCKADLSGCKDYHKRHKVCEMHSKAPKAIAGGIEQRFCQQCSRFHVLKEFDEGKRSCRRRLAGHNERRRKPHTETHSLFGLGNSFLHTELSTPSIGSASFYFPEDSKPSSFLHPHRGSVLDYGLHGYGHSLTRSTPWTVTKGRNDSIPTFQLENLKTPMTTSKSYSGLHLGGHHFLEGPLGPLGQGLSLSSSTGGVLGSLEQSRLGSCSQALSSVSGMIDSGRALSLLSSQSWASPRSQGAPTPMSAGSSQAADSMLEQLVASSSDSSSRGSRFAHHLRLPSGGSSTTSAQQQFDTQFSVQSGGLDSVALNCGLTATGNGTYQRQACGNGNMLGGLGRYEEPNPMLGLVGGGQGLETLRSGYGGSHDGRPTMDLMQMPSIGAHHGPSGSLSNGVHSGVSVSGGQYNGFSSLRPFESSIFTSQQLM
ncbi:hypothetical protein KC19_5G075500 [Ceratodon purpureus]|uniref:SBP-type domain-containing protein n=1 Tax=Ceratodon purpureus TaxID=3225 RepID=A0A8T0HYX2_CERPU|nr:hypothetical protein KC19_5G075500 [Ceratodon purpureus]